MIGRKRDPIWKNYISLLNGKITRAKCQKCKHEMVANVSRMRQHTAKCTAFDEINENYKTAEVCETSVPTTMFSSSDSEVGIKCDPYHLGFDLNDSEPSTLRMHIQEQDTSTDEIIKIDMQIARFIFATNSSYDLVEHPEFIKTINLLRPNYMLPSAAQISSTLLEEVYIETMIGMRRILEGKSVCMAFDIWSNFSYESFICVTVIDTVEECSYLIDILDTSENKINSDFFTKLLIQSIKKCHAEFGCTVRSFLTDSQSATMINVEKMRNELKKLENIDASDVIYYSCSAHILKMLSNDIECPAIELVLAALVKVQKSTCTIGEITEIWLDLVSSIENIDECSKSKVQLCIKRLNEALTPAHYVANITDPRYQGLKLTTTQFESAMEYIHKNYPAIMPEIINYQGKAYPFRNYLFGLDTTTKVKSLTWWTALERQISEKLFQLMKQLHSAAAASAGIDREFSAYGLDHSKLRISLGNDKAAKILAIYKNFNSNSHQNNQWEFKMINK